METDVFLIKNRTFAVNKTKGRGANARSLQARRCLRCRKITNNLDERTRPSGSSHQHTDTHRAETEENSKAASTSARVKTVNPDHVFDKRRFTQATLKESGALAARVFRTNIRPSADVAAAHDVL